jgi:hypothetical protein
LDVQDFPEASVEKERVEHNTVFDSHMTFFDTAVAPGTRLIISTLKGGSNENSARSYITNKAMDVGSVLFCGDLRVVGDAASENAD